MLELLSNFFKEIFKCKKPESYKSRAYDCIEVLDFIIDGDDEIIAQKLIPIKRFLLDLTREKSLSKPLK